MPLDVDNTRFPPLRVSCSPGTGAGASSPRHETHRNVANSRSFRSAKGLRRHTSSVLYAPSALSAMALSHESPTVPVDGSIPYSITLVVYTVPMHCVPWPLWWIRPSAPPRDAAHETACSNARNGSSCVFMAMAHAPDAKLAHDVHHLAAADLGRIPALGDQLRAHLPVTVHGHEEIRVDLEDVAGQRPMPRPHAADGTRFEHAAAARREKPAVQRFEKDPADRPDLETAFMLVDVRGHQRRVGSSPAAKKADAVVKISFARRNSAFSARSLLSSAIASSADCLVSSATVASDWSRQRRSDSGAIPGSFATTEIAFVSDEYEERDSASSPTAFALNSGVYRAPFAMVPSSPIESEEIRNKNQFISYHPPPSTPCANASR